MNGMLQYQLFSLYMFLFVGLWWALRSEADESNKAVDYAPLWLVLGIGIYAAGSIFYGVINLKDCPEAAKEVEIDVKEAIAAMKKKGVRI